MANGPSALHFVDEWAKIARGAGPLVPPFLDRKVVETKNLPSSAFDPSVLRPPPALIGEQDQLAQKMKPITVSILNLGGGFRSYGGGRDEQPRRQGGFNREFAPSKAGETDDWGKDKRSPVGGGFERRERGERGGFFTDSQSRADEVDNWASKKSFVPLEPRRYERRGGVWDGIE